jgi:molybdopterin-biosynthesis enzyme MoeA-like protein
VVVGDEILTGKTADANTIVLARMLRRRGVDLERVVTIGDDVGVISSVVGKLSNARDGGAVAGAPARGFDYVFTSGGIGPTHDDMTYLGVATAFGTDLELHQPTADAMQRHKNMAMNAARLRMALFPQGDNVHVHTTPGSWVPLVQVGNVYVLPGVPRLFERMVTLHEGLFGDPEAIPPRALHVHQIQRGEGDIAAELVAITEKHPGARIGSYPQSGGIIKLTVEADSAEEAEAISALFREQWGDEITRVVDPGSDEK